MPSKKKAIIKNDKPCCGLCTFFDPDDDHHRVMKAELGICRRFPPVVVGIDEDGNTVQGQPTVGSDWILCGEFHKAMSS